MVADPYLAAADRHLDEAAIVALLRPPDSPVEPAPTPTAAVPADASARSAAPASSDDAQDAQAIAAAALAGASEPIHLSHLGNLVHEAVGSEVVRSSKWFGAGSIRAFLLARFPDWRSEGHLIWDPSRHEAPAPQSVAPAPAPAPSPPAAPAPTVTDAPQVELPAPIALLTSAVGLPRLPSSTWPLLFEVLERHDASGGFSLSGAAIWARDELVARGLPVSRKAVNFAIRGCGFGGARLDADPPATREQLREAFTVSVLDRAGAAGLTVTREDEAALRSWLAGEG
jgi:hypothetical protein